MSLALARKYRPKSFAEVAVQSHVSNTLRGAIARGRVAHGYLLSGPRGVGKTTLARVLAMALNCENKQPDGEPCGICDSCIRIWSGSTSLDVVEIDAASNRGVDDARDLRERARYAPSGEHRWKVYIVDEAHMLTRDAWNALLKILEEPPPRVVFVFATTEPHKIAQAATPVLSRLQRFDFKRIGPADVRERLTQVLAREAIEAEPDALSIISRAADGSMRDALSLTDQALALGEGPLTVRRVRDALGLVAEDEFLAILDLITEKRAADVFPAIGRLVEQGVDLGQFMVGLGDILRSQLAVELGAAPQEVSESTRAALIERKGRVSGPDLIRMITILAEAELAFRRSGQQQLLLELMLVRLAMLDRTIELEDVLRQVGGDQRPEPPRSSGAPRGGGGTVPREPYRAQTGGGPTDEARPHVPRTVEDVAPPRRSTPASASSAGLTMASAVATSVTRGGAAPAPSREAALEINAIVGAWDDIVDGVRRERPMIGSMLEHCLPTAATAAGALTLHVDNGSAHDSLAAKAGDVVATLKPRIPGLDRIIFRAPDRPGQTPNRMSQATIRNDTIAALRKRDPVLRAAIEALDLELLD